MEGYIKDTILSKEALKEAQEFASKVDWYGVWQYYNLFSMFRYDLDVELHELNFIKELHKYSRKDYNIGSYLLKYVPGSFTRMHDDHGSEITIVTLLDSTDLVGGYPVIHSVYNPEDSRPSDLHCARVESEMRSPPYGQDIIPDVVEMENGESMVYGPRLRHGVSAVHSGSRIVLVSWFSNIEKGKK